MQRSTRFGRKLPIPSTAFIKHELRIMMATDTLSQRLKSQDKTDQQLGIMIGGFMDTYGISSDRAYMLMDRMKVDRSLLRHA